MNTAKMRVSGPILVKLLQLPPGTIASEAVITVSHDDIPPNVEHVTPVFRRHPTRRGKFLAWTDAASTS